MFRANVGVPKLCGFVVSEGDDLPGSSADLRLCGLTLTTQGRGTYLLNGDAKIAEDTRREAVPIPHQSDQQMERANFGLVKFCRFQPRKFQRGSGTAREGQALLVVRLPIPG